MYQCPVYMLSFIVTWKWNLFQHFRGYFDHLHLCNQAVLWQWIMPALPPQMKLLSHARRGHHNKTNSTRIIMIRNRACSSYFNFSWSIQPGHDNNRCKGFQGGDNLMNNKTSKGNAWQVVMVNMQYLCLRYAMSFTKTHRGWSWCMTWAWGRALMP